MTISKSNRFVSITIMFCLLPMILSAVWLAVSFRELSFTMALANPELEHLRVPVLNICYVLIAIFIINLFLAEILLVRVVKNSIYSGTSVRLLKAMGWLFISGLLPLTTLYVLTKLNVGGSITQVYTVIFAFVYLTAGLIFLLLANLTKNVLASN